jgi:hypothetical protein
MKLLPVFFCIIMWEWNTESKVVVYSEKEDTGQVKLELDYCYALTSVAVYLQKSVSYVSRIETELIKPLAGGVFIYSAATTILLINWTTYQSINEGEKYFLIRLLPKN